ncbi:aldo/keto reductase [Muricoccus pecuniae]|uniref:Aryl-alcohol dehydrogenase-like predicted oxidoreductase n=1 Tax=Muricoccus pecuniae TaxID=693023 RepID=A0A840YLV4_9PROT|nr:aldo/keto reductase [Roseomonas pecuniae]MBB5695813.1 aryl-alcohol dehydrogenase-like predicted oxidoreductase [Roseomonas pecuniae]
MRTRHLTPSFATSGLGLGCMGMSEFYGPRDDETSMQVLHRAVELGIDLFDTADMYGPHHNEELIGRFLHEGRARVRVATKFGIVRRPGEYARSIDNSPDYVRSSCEGSLRRLGVERIDLYYVHRIDAARPIEDTMEALAALVREGKVGHVGLCEVSAATLRRAHAVHPVTAVQTEYSLWSREVEAEVLPACRELGVGFVPYAPLGRGYLTGAIGADGGFAAGDFRAALPRFSGDNMAANQGIVDVVRAKAAEIGCTPGQVALAWLLAKGDDIVPIPGTKRLRWLEENAAAADIALPPGDVKALDDALPSGATAGARYTQEGMKGLNA